MNRPAIAIAHTQGCRGYRAKKFFLAAVRDDRAPHVALPAAGCYSVSAAARHEKYLENGCILVIADLDSCDS